MKIYKKISFFLIIFLLFITAINGGEFLADDMPPNDVEAAVSDPNNYPGNDTRHYQAPG